MKVCIQACMGITLTFLNIYIYIHAYIYTHIYTHMFVYMCVYVLICTYIFFNDATSPGILFQRLRQEV
jgi:hypothetical protein